MVKFKSFAAAWLLISAAIPAWAEVQFAIGEPAENSVKSGIGQVSGWAVSDRKIVSIEAFIDGSSLGPVPYGGSRLDVAAAFPAYPDAEFSGWAMKWNYALHEPGEHLLTIVITEDDDTQTSREVVFSTIAFHSEFISDPAAVRTVDAIVSSPEDGRLVLEGAEIDGEIVDVELAWDKASQQFLIDRVTYPQAARVNQAPTAYAGPDMEVDVGTFVIVDGSGSDPDGFIASRAWSWYSGSPVMLQDADQWSTRFFAPEEAGQVRLRLTVTDNEGKTASDDVIVTFVEAQSEPAPNASPLADAGPDLTVEAGAAVSISGAASDSDGQIVGWQWTQLSGLAVSLQGAGTPTVSFTAPGGAGSVLLRLTVTDDDGATAADEVLVTVEPPPQPNQAPTADAGPDLTAQQGDTVAISGNASDPDGTIVSWSWAQVSGTTVSLSGAASPNVQFAAPATAGDIRLRLTVTDDDGASDSDDVIVTIEDAGQPDTTTGTTVESMLAVINAARGQDRNCGTDFFSAQPPFSWSGALADAAMEHSMDMARNAYFAHTSLDGRTVGDRLFAVWGGRFVGENIAASSVLRSDEYIVQLWLDSPGHCALIMEPGFTDIGVGYGRDDENGYTYQHFWTLDFGG